jgi:predicted lipid-binding transport protein (Tim44 family)
LIAGSLASGFGPEGRGLGLVLQQLLLGVGVVVFATLVRRRRAASGRPARGALAPPPVEESPPRVTTGARQDDSSLDDGLRDIRRMDPKFDPARFTGYIEMVFRATHTVRMSRDVASLRDRVTPELYGELQAQGDQLRSLGQASHVDQIEIRAEVTEAWHEDGRDFVTAYIVGAMRDYTVDERTGALVAGSKTAPQDVEAFWTFTRPAGLNPWMLSAIQTS